jgi:pyruvate/2-oxoglutarate/acetoin dehydrogenase E1 component
MVKIKYSDAILEAIDDSMNKNNSVIIMGLGITDPKAVFGTTKGLLKKYGSGRVIETPTSENAITGIALGASIKGLRPIITHQRVEFALLSMEQIINQISKWNYMTAGKQSAPIVIRLIIGKGWGQGPQHSQSLEVLFSHIPGLKVVAPSNAYDAKGLLKSAIEDKNPVIFFEHRWLHNIIGEVPRKNYKIEIGKAKVVQKGKDISIISFSESLVQVMRVNKLLKKHGINAEIIDLRSLRPLDEKTIIKSVKKTKNIIVVDNGWTKYGISSEIISLISEKAFKYLKSAPVRIGVQNHSIASTRELAKFSYLDSSKIVKGVLNVLKKKKNVNNIIKEAVNMRQTETDIPYRDFRGPF